MALDRVSGGKESMTDHTGCKRGFYASYKAWYADKNKNPEVTFGMYHEEGGTSGEMCIEWIILGNKSVSRLEVFNDAWSSLSLFTDLIQELSIIDGKYITPDEFVDILKKCNFEDLTKYKQVDDNFAKERLKARLQTLEKEVEKVKSELNDF